MSCDFLKVKKNFFSTQLSKSRKKSQRQTLTADFSERCFESNGLR